MAYGWLGMTPQQFWDMTPREFHNKQQGFFEKEAWAAILYRRAMNEKKVSVDKLLNRNASSKKKVVSLDEHRNMIHEMEKRFNSNGQI